MSPLRVLYLLRYFPTLTETFVLDEMVGVAARGIEVGVLGLGRRSDGRLAEDPPGVRVHALPRRSLLPGRPSPAGQQLARWQRDKDAARLPGLVRLARDHHRLHVHFAGEAAEVAWAIHQETGLPYTVMVHAADLFRPRPSLPVVLSGAAKVLTVARHHQELLEGMGIDAGLLRCGPDPGRHAGLPPPPEGPLRALFIGRDVPKKGLGVLLDAWRLAPPGARLEVISDARFEPPPGVRARGLLPRTAVRQALARSNLVVLPARQAPDGDQDGVPLVLMEALAAGRPVISTPVSGIPELVDESVGWLVPPDDPVALARALLAASDAQERQIRGVRGPGRLLERGFTLEAQVEGALAAWKSS